MTLRTLLLATALLGPSLAAADCIKTNGTVMCSNGTTGFTDDSGNVWLQDRRGRQSVIQNLDDDNEASSGKPVIHHDGTLHELR